MKIALVFVLVGILPLFLSTMRFKINETDTEEQKTIKENMKRTQLIIACIFFVSAVILAACNFIITDQAILKIIVLLVYGSALIGAIVFAISRQIKLQKLIRQMMKKQED